MLAFVLALIALISPDALNTGGARMHASAIAVVAASDDPIPGFTREETAAIMTVVAYEESRFAIGARRGDLGISPFGACGAYQIHARSKAQCDQLTSDPLYAAKLALYIMRLSAKSCPSSVLAPYAGGCGSRAARAISDRRVATALRVAHAVQ